MGRRRKKQSCVERGTFISIMEKRQRAGVEKRQSCCDSIVPVYFSLSLYQFQFFILRIAMVHRYARGLTLTRNERENLTKKTESPAEKGGSSLSHPFPSDLSSFNAVFVTWKSKGIPALECWLRKREEKDGISGLQEEWRDTVDEVHWKPPSLACS